MSSFTLMYMCIVILCLASNGVAYSPIFYFHERNGRNLTAINGYFNGLCVDFSICLNKGQSQFAVLTIGELGNNQFSPPKPNNHQQCANWMNQPNKDNYNVALPKMTKPKVHSEDKLLRALTGMKAWSKGKGVVDVYLFSYWSPCNDCANLIVNNLQKLTNVKLHLSWQAFYSQHGPAAFFKSLEILFKLDPKNLKVYWQNDKKKCGKFETISYQYLFYECVVQKVPNGDKIAEDLAKTVNKLTYTCIKDMDTYGKADTCIDQFVNTLKAHGKQFKDCKPKKSNEMPKPLLGPPLDPKDPIQGSQSLKDLHGDYN